MCNFTNHTVLPEALEKWPIVMLEKLLPRHTQIIYDINWRFLQTVRTKFGDDWGKISELSIIDETEDGQKNVRMAYLAVVASKNVNGVAAIHSDILKHDVFKAFYDLWPEKFQNKTNGVTPRRCVLQLTGEYMFHCGLNPLMSSLSARLVAVIFGGTRSVCDALPTCIVSLLITPDFNLYMQVACLLQPGAARSHYAQAGLRRLDQQPRRSERPEAVCR